MILKPILYLNYIMKKHGCGIDFQNLIPRYHHHQDILPHPAVRRGRHPLTYTRDYQILSRYSDTPVHTILLDSKTQRWRLSTCEVDQPQLSNTIVCNKALSDSSEP